jgi:hypothetical protein
MLYSCKGDILKTKKVLISIPEQPATRMRATMPSRTRSQAVAKLIEQEVERREHHLLECAQKVEADQQLNQEMKEWDVTLLDGLEDETW